MALMCSKRLKYVRNEFALLTNGLYMWEMTYMYGKWLKYLKKTATICGK